MGSFDFFISFSITSFSHSESKINNFTAFTAKIAAQIPKIIDPSKSEKSNTPFSKISSKKTNPEMIANQNIHL